MSRIRSALESLLDFPDPSPVPLTDPFPDKEMRESAARLIGLAADFVHAVDEEGHIRELHNRVLQFDDLTGTQSRLNKFREATYGRIMEAFRQAPPGTDRLSAAELGGPVEDFPGGVIKAAGIITQDIELRRLSPSDLSKRFAPKFCSDGFVTLLDVKKFLHDPESLRWSPCELQQYSWYLARMSACTEPLMLAMQLMMDFNQIQTVRLWGSFLLDAAAKVIAPPVDERLPMTFMYSEKAVQSLKEAAKDIAPALAVDVELAPMAAKGQVGESKTPGVASKSAEDSETALDGAAASTDEAKKPHWDAEKFELRYKDHLIKKFKTPAPNQIAVLGAFENDGWPDVIDDPIPGDPDITPKRRLAATVEALNDNHKTSTRMMYFTAERFGQGIGWHDGSKLPGRPVKKPMA